MPDVGHKKRDTCVSPFLQNKQTKSFNGDQVSP